MTTKEVQVTQIITVWVDESKFTEEFMRGFRETFYDFRSLDDHIKHLAQLQARGLIDNPDISNDFIEGYGPANEMGIRTRSGELEYETA